MRASWHYVLGPLLGALAVALGLAALGAPASPAMVTATNVAGFAAAAGASLAAAAAFGPGDYLRTAWWLLALSPGLLLLDALLFGAAGVSVTRDISTTASAASGALTFVANLAGVLALLVVSRAWSVAGLDLDVSPRSRWGAMALVAGAACALVGAEVLGNLRALAGGDFEALPSLASAGGDVASAALLVPLLLTARRLRGGALAWPWGLLAASTLLWLGFDAVGQATTYWTGHPGAAIPVEEFWRAGACFFQVAAGFAQRRAVKA